MKYMCTLLAVQDMEKAKDFYQRVMGMKITCDLGANVTLDEIIALQSMKSWQKFIETDQVQLKNNAAEVYFEEWEMDEFISRLEKEEIQYVHPLKMHSWGQRAVRFYDPDGHIIEVGEAMPAVTQRFLDQGLTMEETARRMDMPLEAIKEMAQVKKGE